MIDSNDVGGGCLLLVILAILIGVLATCVNMSHTETKKEMIGTQVTMANGTIEGTIKDCVWRGRDGYRFYVIELKTGATLEVRANEVVIKTNVEAAETAKQAKIKQLEAELQSLKNTTK